MSDPFKDAMVEETSRNRLAPDSAAPKVELRPFEDRSSFRALMDDLDNITLQAHHNIDKFKLVDQRPITIKIPTNKKIPHPPSPTSNESSPLSSKPEVVKPEVVKLLLFFFLLSFIFKKCEQSWEMTGGKEDPWF